jgi:hypothetical protein
VASDSSEAIYTASYLTTDRGEGVETQAYWERGVGGRRALVGKIWASADVAGSGLTGWRSEALIGLKQRLGTFGPVTVAGQVSLVGEDRVAEPVAVGAEARLGAGVSLPAQAFVNVEAGLRDTGFGATQRGEMTAGISRGRWLAYGQAIVDEEIQPRWEVNSVWFVRPGLGLQIGARAGGFGNERAITLGVWRRRT